MRRGPAVLLFVTAAFLAAGRSHARDEEKPLPVGRSAQIKEGTYFVEGRQCVPKNVKITLFKGVKVVGRGGAAVIALAGTLDLHGVRDAGIVLEGVTIELQPEFGMLDAQHAEFRDTCGGIVTPPDATAAGRLKLVYSSFQPKAKIDVSLTDGRVEINGTTAYSPVSIRATAAQGAKGNSVTVAVENCCYPTGFGAGLRIEGAKRVEMLTTKVEGDVFALVDCDTIVLDGLLLQSKTVELHQSVRGRFARTTVERCDFQCGKVVLTAPTADLNPETLTIDNCWFDGVTVPSKVKERFINDRAVTSTSGVVAQLQRINANPLTLGGAVRR
jgi:hypothetical protein